METKPLDMQVNSILYSLKIWLTSVALAPLIFLVVDSFTSKDYSPDFEDLVSRQLGMYLLCVVAGSIFSFFTWVLFTLIIKGIITWFSLFPKIKIVIAIIGVLLTIGTFSIFLYDKEFLNEFFYLMVSNCICIAGSSLYYKLEISTEAEGITT
ncbi:hypothetical protein ABIB62_000111 [Mucilaginibacter sp. UYP25]|uniref:hypothetical protein n=1 Tax=unclassified Mucilaginibacter TaxID=2617802 RepID=UPI003396523A